MEFRRECDALRESLGRVGAWRFAPETLTAAEERDAAAEIVLRLPPGCAVVLPDLLNVSPLAEPSNRGVRYRRM
jgi:hypothetical protein